MSTLPSFREVAATSDATLDVVALSLAAEFRDIDAPGALATLDSLAADLRYAAAQTSGTPEELADACGRTLGTAHGFAGDREEYDRPENSMLDLVLTRRRGLPILLSTLYVEVARRAGIELGAVGLPGHFAVGHFGVDPPLLLDPFDGGVRIVPQVSGRLIRPWQAHEVAMRMLNNLVAAYQRRGDLGAAIRAAGMRLALPVDPSERDVLQAELRAIQARLN